MIYDLLFMIFDFAMRRDCVAVYNVGTRHGVSAASERREARSANSRGLLSLRMMKQIPPKVSSFWKVVLPR